MASNYLDAIFGVAGFPVNFFNSSYGKNREKIFDWLVDLGLDALELQCTYGVKMKDDQAELYRKLASERNIKLTIHAPYYVNLGSLNVAVAERSKNEIIKCFALANKLDATRIIFHPGGGYGTDREAGIKRIISALESIKGDIDTTRCKLYPEIGGKTNQLGSLDEIIQICKAVDYCRPCLDLAHLHARENGSLKTPKAIEQVFAKIKQELDLTYLENAHFHVYPVDYNAGGERMHKKFGELNETTQTSMFEPETYHPTAENFISAVHEYKLKPFVICEAHNTQDEGAILMKSLYR